MRRQCRHLALFVAVIGGLASAHMARAQDSFFERFIRAGAPPPSASKPRGAAPTIRHRYASPGGQRSPRYGASAYPARRVGRPGPAKKEVADEPIKAKTNPSTTILVIGDALGDRLAQG